MVTMASLLQTVATFLSFHSGRLLVSELVRAWRIEENRLQIKIEGGGITNREEGVVGW